MSQLDSSQLSLKLILTTWVVKQAWRSFFQAKLIRLIFSPLHYIIFRIDLISLPAYLTYSSELPVVYSPTAGTIFVNLAVTVFMQHGRPHNFSWFHNPLVLPFCLVSIFISNMLVYWIFLKCIGSFSWLPPHIIENERASLQCLPCKLDKLAHLPCI